MLESFVNNEVTPDEMAELIRIVPPSLATVIKQYQHLETCPEGLKSLLGTLSKNSPVCGLLHPSEELHDFVQKVADGAAISDSVCDMEFLQKQIPVLFDLVRNGDSSCVAEELRPLLLALLDVAEKPFNQKTRVPDDVHREVKVMLVRRTSQLNHFVGLMKSSGRSIFQLLKEVRRSDPPPPEDQLARFEDKHLSFCNGSEIFGRTGAFTGEDPETLLEQGLLSRPGSHEGCARTIDKKMMAKHNTKTALMVLILIFL
uniref:Uncharacterized protein n=1 Tax=Branchiostoma floridae TaxID=7739 RepID=C3Z170_BRAFL|eukprot:XP_002597757.1 hypothetical protein BRAFLDRAFT_77340 [Branchiostoma floridae]